MKRKSNKITEQVRKSAKRKRKKPKMEELDRFTPDQLIPMGSTLLNLAMSGTVHGGAKKGTMINIIGASHGGKTVLALTSFPEANMNQAFDEYEFLYDDAERANSFDMPHMFGKATAKRIKAPREDKKDQFSHTVEHFHTNLKHWLKKLVPFIYVLDSFDALDSLGDQKKVDEMADSIEKDKKITGSYGMSKAKGASGLFRNVTQAIADTESVLYVISQTRENVDPMSKSKETRSGGKALKFYAHHEMWLKPIKAIKKKETVIGNTIRLKITKNKLTGKKREIQFDIYDDYGVDDIGSCIDYLINMERWTGGGSSKINHQDDFKFPNCTRVKMIQLIEEEPAHYRKLQRIVQEVWNDFEESIKLDRKNKYR
jgi:recombination protein RecA